LTRAKYVFFVDLSLISVDKLDAASFDLASTTSPEVTLERKKEEEVSGRMKKRKKKKR
jgi:hypothetical protein